MIPTEHAEQVAGLCECGCGERTNPAPRTDAIKGWVKGRPLRYALHHKRAVRIKDRADGYEHVLVPSHPLANRAGHVLEHILVVYGVMGKPLPKGAEIHHVNGVRNDNRHENLVVCQDHRYHRLLHVRAKALRVAGDPNMRSCVRCKAWDNPEVMVPHGKMGGMVHPECRKRYRAEYWRRNGK